MRILSVEHFHTWSWSCGVPELLTFMGVEQYQRSILTPQRILPQRHYAAYDAFLLQNVDLMKFFAQQELQMSVVRMGGMDFRSLDSHLDCHYYDAELEQAGAVIATNTQLFDIATRVNDNSYIIPNGVDLELFRPCPKNNERFTAGFAGNINSAIHMEYKGYIHIVTAVQALMPGVDFITALYNYNQLPHESMPRDFFGRIDCLINASYNEGCSNTIMEALACGVPVICTKVGYHGERLTHEENCLFVERNSESIQAAVVRLRDDKELRDKLSLRGRRFALVNHDIETVARAYRRVFEQLLNKE